MANKNGEFEKIVYSNEIKEKILEQFVVSNDKCITDYLTQMPEVAFLKMSSLQECKELIANHTKYIYFKDKL